MTMAKKRKSKQSDISSIAALMNTINGYVLYEKSKQTVIEFLITTKQRVEAFFLQKKTSCMDRIVRSSMINDQNEISCHFSFLFLKQHVEHFDK